MRSNIPRPRVGVLWRGDPRSQEGNASQMSRFGSVFQVLLEKGIEPVPTPYSDDAAEEVLDKIARLEGVLVWVDPIDEGRDRSRLDAVLREASNRGVWVSAHPDVIMKMGTKDVLVRTRELSWGSDCYIYRTLAEMEQRLPPLLQAGPRVLKQHRGNGGNGVWKVELQDAGADPADSRLRVLHARRGSRVEEMTLRDFLARCAGYFAGSGCMIDQPYQARLADGMVRCYLVQDRVAGFGQQYVTALLPLPPGALETPAPPPRLYYGPDKAEFQALKRQLEREWVPQMQALLQIDTDSLPVLWDADFLYGPKLSDGSDSHVLCEINVSSVYPFPAESLEPMADAVARILAGRHARAN